MGSFVAKIHGLRQIQHGAIYRCPRGLEIMLLKSADIVENALHNVRHDFTQFLQLQNDCFVSLMNRSYAFMICFACLNSRRS